MKYLSVCSGIEAATVAWHPLGWEPVAFSEIEKFPSAVLAHHYPDVPNLGDMTKFKEWDIEQGTIDLIVGGTPCQSFSVAGLRAGMYDPRGNLTLTFLAVLARYNPRWFVWENVPGVFSSISNGGSDFGRFLSALAELGYGCAYRVLDAQYFGVPQRRRRVFVVGYFGDWRPAAAVLFERHSMQGHPPPRREAGERVAGPITTGLGCCRGTQEIESGFLQVLAHGQAGAECVSDGEPSLTCNHEAPILIHDMATRHKGTDGTDRGRPGRQNVGKGHGLGIEQGEVMYTLGANDKHAIAFHASQDPDVSGEVAHPIGAQHNGMSNAVAISCIRESGQGYWMEDDKAGTLRAEGENRPSRPSNVIQQNMQVRRLTPRECERLQGFPDDYTRIPWRGKPAKDCPDGPRYKALGNSMAVPVMRWIGERIVAVEGILTEPAR